MVWRPHHIQPATQNRQEKVENENHQQESVNHFLLSLKGGGRMKDLKLVFIFLILLLLPLSLCSSSFARHDFIIPKPKTVCITLIMKFMQPDRSKAKVRKILICKKNVKIMI